MRGGRSPCAHCLSDGLYLWSPGVPDPRGEVESKPGGSAYYRERDVPPPTD
jgi:hypothetical protein